jgi:hypothetical protein
MPQGAISQNKRAGEEMSHLGRYRYLKGRKTNMKQPWSITITPRAGGVRIRSVSPVNARLVDALAAKLEKSVVEFLAGLRN